jgi:hypothetical protein
VQQVQGGLLGGVGADRADRFPDGINGLRWRTGQRVVQADGCSAGGRPRLAGEDFGVGQLGQLAEVDGDDHEASSRARTVRAIIVTTAH